MDTTHKTSYRKRTTKRILQQQPKRRRIVVWSTGTIRSGISHQKNGSSFDAFASGHTATAFSIATVFALQYNETTIIPIVCYSAATLIGVSRLTEHEHWSSDVFVGALLGYLCGKQVVNNFNKTHQTAFNSMAAKQKYKTELTIVQHQNQIGVLLKW
ncbi:MAG: phosphatase PAP2 family protein [Bacteroidetes bacterium]|nr:phosphatase PAP2 family protein [Bacteroidota bacterium]